MIRELYKESLALLTDQYQLTMAYGYWKNGVHETEAVFNLFFRKHPFKGGYTIVSGLEETCHYLDQLSFSDSDLAYLGSLKGNDGQPIFEEGFLNELDSFEFRCDVDAMPEGTAAFPNEPLLRVKGPVWQCQLLETPLLALTNFPTLIATKSARMNEMAGGRDILDFGLRRAQGIDGGLTASRAAFVGGCSSTSNVLAGKLLGIPVKGTHAHSWIMFFESEREAFEKFAKAHPNNSIFLVDTYDTIEGVKTAIEVGKVMRAEGCELAGIRLDSGDMAELSKQSRKLMDEAGFENAKIVASSEIDEFLIENYRKRGAEIDIYGVGTKLVTGGSDPALGGVYKLAGRKIDGEWSYRLKLSEEEIKINNPGIQQVRRFKMNDQYLYDMIYDESMGFDQDLPVMHSPADGSRIQTNKKSEFEDLLVPVYREGRRVYELPSLREIQAKTRREMKALPPEVKELADPREYFTGLEDKLYKKKKELIESVKMEIAQ